MRLPYLFNIPAVRVQRCFAIIYAPCSKRAGRAVAAGVSLRSSGGGKSEHYRAASQLTAGRVFGRMALSSRSNVRMTTSATEKRPAGALALCGAGRQVMGEMVRPSGLM